jgi:hypothetical protein
MGRSDDRKPVGDAIPQHSRMDDDAQRKRSDAIRRYTQRKGMPMCYGTGDPAKAWPKTEGNLPIPPPEGAS